MFQVFAQGGTIRRWWANIAIQAAFFKPEFFCLSNIFCCYFLCSQSAFLKKIISLKKEKGNIFTIHIQNDIKPKRYIVSFSHLCTYLPYAWHVVLTHWVLTHWEFHTIQMPVSLLLWIFIYLWLCWVFVAAHRLSLVAVSRTSSLIALSSLLSAVASLVVEHGL